MTPAGPAGPAFVVGHGTENDFVLLPDPDGTVHPGADAGTGAYVTLVARLCDRRAGLGGDGVMRVVRTDASEDPHAVAARGEATWFMDYRNADGSLSQMCGNGVRVFYRYLLREGLVEPGRRERVATRDGVKELWCDGEQPVSVDMGTPRLLGHTWVAVPGHRWDARHVDMGNPHAVALLDGADGLADAGDLHAAPEVDADLYPDGVNVELAVRRGDRHVAMRVHERGSGETRSCGTGACAVMVALADAAGERPEVLGEDVTYRVDVPGGELAVTWTTSDRVVLTGPAVLVADGTLTAQWLAP